MDQQKDKRIVIVGLGNPGKKYELTRHNIGVLVAKKVASRLNATFKEEKKFHADIAKGAFQTGFEFHVLLPTTYMNESGRAVKAYLDFYRIATSQLIVVSDDVELPFGQHRFRQKGSSGGHNGLKSIEALLGTQEYSRLKMGVGKDLAGVTLADYVLDIFKPSELLLLGDFVEKGVDFILSSTNEPVQTASSSRE